ncbi:hypothetical protein AB9K32_06350 [Allomuricauda sp. XS_ASV26]|uniref:hypothetical protein n=1 Tax=Allomuricauda sp. XS_ASV26 TaxID=3241292 RepID=UPI00351331F9
MKELEILKSLLASNFQYSFYKDAILNIRNERKEIAYYKDNWSTIVRIVLNKELKDGQALDLIHNTANLPLYENSDEEAYKWLNLMLINASGSDDDVVLDYKDVFKPKEG